MGRNTLEWVAMRAVKHLKALGHDIQMIPAHDGSAVTFFAPSVPSRTYTWPDVLAMHHANLDKPMSHLLADAAVKALK